MRYTTATLAVLVSLTSLTCVQRANANGGGRGIRADLPCPYGGAGGPDATAWGAASTSGPIPYNPGLVTPFSATLVGGSKVTTDDNTLAISSATQYDYYSSAIPKPTDCTPENEFTLNSNGPLEQVIVYKLAAGNALGLAAGDTEVEFNYNTFFDPALATTAGTASFTMGGVNYTSTGGLLPTGTLNDFLFSSTGKYLGELGTDSVGNPSFVPSSATDLAPGGWSSSASGGGGGTVTAPELSATSAISALTLIAGSLMLARGRRRSETFDTGR